MVKFTKPRASLAYTHNHVQDDVWRVLREHRDVVTSNGITMDTLLAQNVVMALPPKAIEAEAILNRSELWNTDMNDKLMSICRSVEGIHCTKINLYFNNDWWNQVDNILMYGPNVTSLP